MSALQRVTLERFTKAVGKKTYNEYSDMTGIERTRLFRLFHGAEMRISEFEIFQAFLKEQPVADISPVDWKSFLSEMEELENLPVGCYELKEQIQRNNRLKNYLEQSSLAA